MSAAAASFDLPDSPGAMAPDAYRLWRVLQVYGPMPLTCRACTSWTCCASRAMKLEHGIAEKRLKTALSEATRKQWVIRDGDNYRAVTREELRR